MPVLAFALLLTAQAKPAPPAKFPLTVESIMRGYALVGHAPRGLRWSPDGTELTFSWAKADGSPDPAYKQYVVKRDGTGLRIGDTSNWPAGPATTPEPKPQYEAYLSSGDIYLRDGTPQPKRLTTNAAIEETPKVSKDGTHVAYMKSGALYSIEVDTDKTTLLADAPSLTSAPVAATAGSTPSEKALTKEENDLFKNFPDTSRVSGSSGPAPGRGRFQGGASSVGLNLDPSGSHAVFTVFVSAQPGRGTDVPAYVTRSGYTEYIGSYPKVGEPEPTSKVLLVDIKTGTKIEVTTPRPGRVGGLRWSPDGMHAVTWAQALDHKDAWIYGFDAATDKLSVLWTEHDDAWIGGPGRGLLGWLPDGYRFYFESENTGYANLMSADPDGGNVKDLTPGSYEVSRVQVDKDHSRFVFVSSEGSPFKRQIDAMTFDGTGKTKLADLSADEDATFSIAPNGKDIAVVRSTPNAPSELYVDDVRVTSTPTEEWRSGPWISPPIVMIPARDGTPVPARLYKPAHWRRGGPAVIFVHGAGYLQNVYDAWSHYFREYMFNHLLMDRGYAVLDIDYRGSAGYGKAWRTAIYRHMGGKDLDDQVDGAAWLIKNLGVAKDRIGIYGGSYGGFLTLMAMFTTPDVFAAGAALRPVSDWANYNGGYTSDILNLPQDDPDAYRISSPIYHAEGLKGALLICHGMVDTNVHFQDTVRLVERLIELHKTNWEVAPFPIEDHDFKQPDSWIDEYSRILALFDRTIGQKRPR
jgi:dipeptidyl aminopeptidase/acylaminoacyl peptidase